MALPARLRVNAAFPFPALVQGSGPVTVSKSNGIWTIGFTAAPADPVVQSLFDTRIDAIGTHIPPHVNFIMTGGYVAAGDGGGGHYEKVRNIAKFPHYPLPTYPNYSFQSADSEWWQYIPEPDGWNAKVAGVVADGVTDDSANMMAALLPFQNSATIPAGGNVTGRLLLPAGTMSLHSVVIYAGGLSISINIAGHSAAQGAAGTVLQSKSSVYPTMFMTYGANQSQFSNITFDGSTNYSGSLLVNSVHYNADNTYVDFLTAPVATGIGKTFNVTSNNFLAVGAAIGVGVGNSHFEVVYITALPGGGNSFVANCVNPHGIGEQVGFGPPSNNNTFTRCSIISPPPFVDNKSSGIFAGNIIPGATVQAAALTMRDCIFSGTGVRHTVTISIGNPSVILDVGHGLRAGTAVHFETTGSLPVPIYTHITYYVLPGGSYDADHYNIALTPGGSPVNTTGGSQSGTHNDLICGYSGFRTVAGGNIKNWLFDNCIFQSCQYGIAGEVMSGSLEVIYPQFVDNLIADIQVNGSVNGHIISAESEGGGQAFLVGTGGAQGGGITIEQCSCQAFLPSDFYVIKFFGNLTLINNVFFNGAVTGPTVGISPRIRSDNLYYDGAPPNSLVAGGVHSVGNYFQLGSPFIPVFYDGSNNPFTYVNNPGVVKKWAVQQINDYGDAGRYPSVFGQLNVMTAAASVESQDPGITYASLGLVSSACQSAIIPYSAFSIANTLKILNVFAIPPRTKIVSVIADVTAPFTGSAGTINLYVGDNATLINQLITPFDAKSGPVTKGLIDADLGPGLAKATATATDGYCPAWGGGISLTVTLNSGSGNLNTLTHGSVTIYVVTRRFN